MKKKFFIHAAAVSCALGLSLAVMSQTVFARIASAASPEGPGSELVILNGEAESGERPAAASDQPISVYVQGEPKGTCILLDSEPYMAVRDFFAALNADIQCIDYGSSLSVAMPGLVMTAQQGQEYFMCNDRYLPVENGVQCLNGTVALPLNSLVKCVGATASWDTAQQRMDITGDGVTPLENGSQFYDSTDLYWLSRLISAAAADKSFETQVAVGSACVNRLGQEEFGSPQNIYEVAFGKNQFEMVTNGMIYSDPAESAELAAKLALEGWDLAKGAVYVSEEEMDRNYHFVTAREGLRFYV